MGNNDMIGREEFMGSLAEHRESMEDFRIWSEQYFRKFEDKRILSDMQPEERQEHLWNLIFSGERPPVVLAGVIAGARRHIREICRMQRQYEDRGDQYKDWAVKVRQSFLATCEEEDPGPIAPPLGMRLRFWEYRPFVQQWDRMIETDSQEEYDRAHIKAVNDGNKLLHRKGLHFCYAPASSNRRPELFVGEHATEDRHVFTYGSQPSDYTLYYTSPMYPFIPRANAATYAQRSHKITVDVASIESIVRMERDLVDELRDQNEEYRLRNTASESSLHARDAFSSTRQHVSHTIQLSTAEEVRHMLNAIKLYEDTGIEVSVSEHDYRVSVDSKLLHPQKNVARIQEWISALTSELSSIERLALLYEAVEEANAKMTAVATCLKPELAMKEFSSMMRGELHSNTGVMSSRHYHLFSTLEMAAQMGEVMGMPSADTAGALERSNNVFETAARMNPRDIRLVLKEAYAGNASIGAIDAPPFSSIDSCGVLHEGRLPRYKMPKE